MSKKWKPLEQRYLPPLNERDPEVIALAMKQMNCDRQTALEAIARDEEGCTFWRNDLYQVQKRPLPDTDTRPPMVHLNIRRIDGGPILRDWRHFQQIKNELVGPECEGVELYPAESRKVDQSNKYHLFVCIIPGIRLPFGWSDRDVDYTDGTTPGSRQRRLEPQLQDLENQ